VRVAVVESTWNTPSSTRRIEMSNVPPPGRTADDAGVTLVEAIGERRGGGSLIMRSTSRPAMRPASRVAVRCASLK